ncbi:MAG: sensor histidine kinase [Flavobacterium sp.]|uniref:tetratricopeptide repeat-containing sensor histidine kinase n=1 Tax=Flavobacterium sp. TaxID=239 RepID=UPI00262A401E|nr:sensor histidine kinase [Flavobacterium sp.]MDD5150080.1 sensor histidine kinase [Flavobacterium sp.]
MKNTTLLFFLFFVIGSCTKPKVANLSSQLFEKNSYKTLNQDKKLVFLDSLNSSLSSLKNDTLTRNFLFDLSAEYYYLSESSKSLAVCQKVLKLSEHTKDTMAIAKSFYYIGDTYEVKQKDSAYYYYHQAEKLYRLLNNQEMTGKMLFNKAYVLFYEGNFLESEILLSKALQLLKNSEDKKLLFSSCTLMGSTLSRLEEYNNAEKYYLLAKKVLNHLLENDVVFVKNNNYKISVSVKLAEVYRKTAQYNKAIQELESIMSPTLKKDWPTYYATIIGNLGYTKMKSGNLSGVEKLLKEALDISRKNSNEASQIYKLSYLGEYYAVVRDTLHSISYLKQSLQLAEKLQSSDDIKISLKLLSKIDYRNNSFYNKRYIDISDSLTKVQRNNRNKYARIEYETSVVEDNNKELSIKNLYLILGLLAVILIAGGILTYRYIENKKRELAHQQQHQKAEEEIFELLKDYQTKFNAIKLKEQNRISRELHDSVLNKLYGTRLQLGILNSSDALEVKEKRLGYVDLLQEIELEIRDISHDLHTDDIEDHWEYIHLLSDLIQEKNELATTHFSFSDESNLNWNTIDGLVKITIFRIVQEALSNVIKYSEAAICIVTLTKNENNKLLLLIEDNGEGFESTTQENDGIGLKNMQERARLAQAELTIASKLGEGTKIEVVFNCQY